MAGDLNVPPQKLQLHCEKCVYLLFSYLAEADVCLMQVLTLFVVAWNGSCWSNVWRSNHIAWGS